MATLPSSAPISLDVLLTRHRARASAPAPRRRSHVTSATPAHAPISADNEPLLDDALPREALVAPERPVALVLTVQVMTCACGTVHRAPAAYALAQYAVNANSFRFTRAELDRDTAGLPRSIREIATRIPFCERCF